MKPYIYRTHDGGKTWTNVVAGIPEGAYVNSVKEDPKIKGLLYAATELRVYVSFDDGNDWQPLQLNMPVTSVRDILVHGDDLDIATHGRGFWVMDQMSSLRQLATNGSQIVSEQAYLFKPGDALSIQQGGQNGTPLPHEEPQELNPPGGVLVDYWLKAAPNTPVKLELIDSKGTVRACVASDTPVKPVDTEAINVQAIWEEPALPPPTTPGTHRAVLNIAAQRGFGRAAAPPPHDACSPPAGSEAASARPDRGLGAAGQGGPGQRRVDILAPGDYTVELTVDGKTYTQPVKVKPDPRGATEDHANEGTHDRS